MRRGQQTKRRRVPQWTIVIGIVTLILAGLVGPVAVGAAADRPTIGRIDIGFDGRYKPGYWTPVRVEISGVAAEFRGRLELIAHDPEGMPVSYVIDEDRAPTTTTAGKSQFTGYVKFGRARASLTVRLHSGQNLLAERQFGEKDVSVALGVHQPLLVTLRQNVAIDEAARQVFTSDPAVSVVANEPHELPDRWFGYESVHTLTLGTSDLTWLDKLTPRQLRAMDEWLRLGGRLVISAGRNAATLQARGSPWSDWIPGQVEEAIELRKAAGIESYAAAEQRLLGPDDKARLTFAVLKGVRGRVEAVESLAVQGDCPVVVTYPAGFGQAVFVAVDIDQPPVSDWPGRARFLAKVLQTDRTLQAEAPTRESQGQVSHLGFDDLSGQLRSALDQFPGVTTIAFGWIVTMVLGYILLVGPADYFLHRKLGRAEATWITFPLAAVGFALLAIWLGGRSKETRLRLNQVDVIDVESSTGLIRGTTWLNIYSPKSETADWKFEITPEGDSKRQFEADEFLASWQGVPGRGVGALGNSAMTLMSSGSYTTHLPLAAAGSSERSAADRSSGYVESLPIAVAGTRCLSGRWHGSSSSLKVAARLRSESLDGQLQGSFHNPWKFRLTEWALLRGNWMYRGERDLEPGDEVSLAEFSGARYLDWHLTRRRVSSDAKDFTIPWDDSSFEVPRIVEMMMFHRSAGGQSYTRIVGRYQQYLDLTDQLRLGRAILVGRGPAACRPSRDGQAVDESYDQQVAFYRVVLPVEVGRSAEGSR